MKNVLFSFLGLISYFNISILALNIKVVNEKEINTKLTGTIKDVEHIIFFMQENRPFDHYFGTLSGVRGFDDRAHPPILSTFNNIFFQPVDKNNLTKYQLPWHADTNRTSATCMDAPEMGFEVDTAMWNKGKMDSWNTERDQGMGMAYFKREDLPYYFALAEEFTIGDQYFQSTFTETDPNRLFFFTGSNGKSANWTSEILDNTIPDEGLPWITTAEILEKNNITWKVFQEEDNFGDNGFQWFSSFMNSKEGEPLYEKGMKNVQNLAKDFGRFIDEGKLPQVSFIVAPRNLSEHANAHPAAGEDLTARIIKELSLRPEVYKKSVFILNYDEGGQFFDHHWTPTPPATPEEGKSTVDVNDEIVVNKFSTKGSLPMGMGFRVPLIIVSPWTRGGYVVSEVFDHTSCLRFLEKRFDIEIPTISKWRRSVAGDLTSAFDFKNPNYTFPNLPSTVGYADDSIIQCDTLPKPEIPVEQSIPKQEPGTRKARQLPYEFEIIDTISEDKKTLNLRFFAKGESGGAFQLYDFINPKNAPRKYTLHGKSTLEDSLNIGEKYDFSVHGPNGFVRRFTGKSNHDSCILEDVYSSIENGKIYIEIKNKFEKLCNFSYKDNAYNSIKELVSETLHEKQSKLIEIDVTNSGNWYDVSISIGSRNLNDERYLNNEQYYRRLMGRIERINGTGDPANINPLYHFVVPKTIIKSSYFLASRYAKGHRKNKDTYKCHKDSSSYMCRNEEHFGFLKLFMK